MSDPYGLGYELDNTPRWLHDNTGPGVGAFCDPFGYESSVQVMGGVHDPGREQHVWYCRNRADGRYRMTCTQGHTGTMRLCYAHVYMTRRRMSGLCPRCAFPAEARQVHDDLQRLTARWQAMLPGDERTRAGRRIEELRQSMTDMYQRGDIRTGAPLTLTEVS